MRIRYFLAIITAKVLITACKCIGHPGTNFPGKIALKIDGSILSRLLKRFIIIMVTGTNGKTTTTKMISEILKKNGVAHITNKSGANLVSGIASTIFKSVDLLGRCAASTALFEIDEAAFDKAASVVQPDFLVVTNFFRDQLDRHGELFAIVKKVLAGIEKSPKTTLILNADDPFCGYLGKKVPNQAVYYGIEQDAIQSQTEQAVSCASYCILCKTKYDFAYMVYGHLGGYKCSHCGFQRPEPDVRCIRVNHLGSAYSDIAFKIDNSDKIYNTRINTPGLYNIYNALAATTCGSILQFPVQNTIEALTKYKNSFGRMETISVHDKNIKLILAKNPASFDQVLSYLCNQQGELDISIVINDNGADGHDISWLWDVDFEKLNQITERLAVAWVSGIRAEDMAVRLKYAGIPAEKIHILKDYNRLINEGLNKILPGNTFYIISTYTAMMDIRKLLKKRFGLKGFWQ